MSLEFANEYFFYLNGTNRMICSHAMHLNTILMIISIWNRESKNGIKFMELSYDLFNFLLLLPDMYFYIEILIHSHIYIIFRFDEMKCWWTCKISLKTKIECISNMPMHAWCVLMRYVCAVFFEKKKFAKYTSILPTLWILL